MRLFLGRTYLLLTLLLLSPAAAAAYAGAPSPTPGLVVKSERLMITNGGPQLGMVFNDIVEIANEGGQEQTEIVLPLVPNHMQLQVMGDITEQQVREFDDRVVLQLSLPPGQSRQIAMSYAVPSRLPHVFHRARLYRTEQMAVSVPDLELVAEVAGLADGGTVEMDNGPVHVYRNSEPLEAAPDMAIGIRANVAKMQTYFWRMAALFLIPIFGLIAIGVRSVSMKKKRRSLG